MHSRNSPFFLNTNNINEIASEINFYIIPILNCFVKYSLKNFGSFAECLYKNPNNEVLFNMKKISWFQNLCFGNMFVVFFFSKNFDHC